MEQIDSADIQGLLHCLDILIDGPFLEEQANPMLRWRGSANQNIWLISDRYSVEDIRHCPIEKGTDVTLTTDGRLIISGVQDAMLLHMTIESLYEKNILNR